MPKVKSVSAAKKRFKKTGNGKFKVGKGFRRHLLTKKTRKTKRNLRRTGYVSSVDHAHIARALPY